tara:strand:+ start:142 stop:252 length:111 start_codon:yes stop_codon:yes gene_type:complete
VVEVAELIQMVLETLEVLVVEELLVQVQQEQAIHLL